MFVFASAIPKEVCSALNFLIICSGDLWSFQFYFSNFVGKTIAYKTHVTRHRFGADAYAGLPPTNLRGSWRLAIAPCVSDVCKDGLVRFTSS